MGENHEVVIIGSGPAGWSSAIYLARAGLRPLVLAGERAGGQLMLTTVVENFPGFPDGIDGPLLMASMRKQAERFGTIVIDKNVTSVDFSTKPMRVVVGEKTYSTRTVLIATGAETVWLGVPGEQELIGRGVSSCAVCDAAFFRGKRTIVVGGGDAAMEDAYALTKFASSVTIVHRRDSFKASKIMQDRVLSSPLVNVLWNSAVEEIVGTTTVSSLRLRNLKTNEISTIEVDGVFVAIGHMPTSSLFSGKIQLDEKKYIVTRQSFSSSGLALAQSNCSGGVVAFPTMTSADGVFAAGDCVDFRYKQAITSAGLGAMAALDIQWWLESQATSK